MKKLLLALSLSVMSLSAVAGTWSSPVAEGGQQYNPAVTSAGVLAAAAGYGPSQTALSGSCVTGSTHTFYDYEIITSTRPPVGNRGLVRFYRQTCN